jgi:hypothetical protein
MRKTGSRDPRESLDASAKSPLSIAVNTFSIRFGSRRNQRPPHQKIRSITTVRPTIDTMRIGHMMGPPLRKLSIKKLEPSPLGLVGASPGDALNVAVTVAVGEVASPGDAGTAGPAGDVAAVGNCSGAAGFARAPGLTTGAGAPGGDVCGGAGGGDCANEVSASARENRQAVSNVFIV